MKPKLIYIALLSLTISTACNENRIFEQHEDPSGNLEWNSNETLEYDVNIKDTTLDYKVIVALRYAQGLAFAEIPVVISRTSPSGENQLINHTFRPRDDEGNYQGEAAGDIWDLEEVLQYKTKFSEVGNYHYTIRHLHDRDKIHMVMEVGLIVDKVINPPR